jgi:hypothetical protein
LLTRRAETEGDHIDVRPLEAYVIGRSAMTSVLADPNRTAGLALSYRLIEYVDQFGVAFAGADDLLAGFDLAAHADARAEIDREIVHLAARPAEVVSFDRDKERFAEMVGQWSRAVGLEQAIDPLFENFLINIPLRHVMLALANSSPQFVAERLDSLGHPALAVAVLANRDHVNFDTLLRLIVHALPAFDAQGNWTRRWTARLLLNTFESRILESADRNIRAEGSKEVEVPQGRQSIDTKIADLAERLVLRGDGRRLVVEWIAHLINATKLREGRGTRQHQGPDYRLINLRHLLDSVVSRFAHDHWVAPQEIWQLFGGATADFPAESGETISSDRALPAWVDGRGQRDAVSSPAVAIALAMDEQTATVRAPSALPWLRLVCMRIETEPQLHWLGRLPSATLLHILAWPIGRDTDPVAWIGRIWEDAADARLRARFYRFEQDRESGSIDRCAAMAELGHRALLSVFGRSDFAAVARPLAAFLGELVDEIRYGIPPIGNRSWATLEGNLAGALSSLGLLSGSDECRRLFARLEGDDDALAAAAVNAAANGVRRELLAASLKAAGIEPSVLLDRWLAWNERIGGPKLKETPFAVQLAAVADVAS